MADAGLGAALVLANLHHRWIVPLMERELRIYEMGETANPVLLVRSRLLHDRFPLEYAATRARRAISLKAVRHGNDDLWSFVMLPDAPPVSRLPPFLCASAMRRCDSDISLFLAEGGRERRAVRPAHGPSPSARAVQRREKERVIRKKERRIRRRERREQRDEEYRLREQQGLSPPATSEYSSSGEGEEEESDGGQAPPERWEPALPHQESWRWQRNKRLGRERKRPSPGGLQKRRRAPWRRRRASRRRLGARQWRRRPPPQCPVEPSRKRKRGFSTLR
jgi:hypothetical protein